MRNETATEAYKNYMRMINRQLDEAKNTILRIAKLEKQSKMTFDEFIKMFPKNRFKNA